MSKKFEGWMKEAWEAGLAAGKAAVPAPMVVVEADGLSDRPAPGGKSWYVSEGMCGFAWVKVRPGTSSFARWLVKTGKARKSYSGGVDIWVGEFNQSVARKEACAYAMANVLQSKGVQAYGQSRLD